MKGTNGSVFKVGPLLRVRLATVLDYYFHVKMKHLVFILCLVVSSVMAKEQKISLEDIERDNLKSEKVPIRSSIKPPPVGSPGQYGFLPVKTVNDYVRQQPKQQFLQQIVQKQQYVPQEQPKQQFLIQEPPKQQFAPQYVPKHQYQPQYVQYATVPQQYYYQQPQQYQQYENVPYITDNNIPQQQQQQQQYYTQQYVYLQPYTAPSTAIQTVVDPKGGLQYIMYVPTYPENEQNYETNYEEPQTVPAVQPHIKYAETEQQLPQQEQPQVPFYSPKHEPKSLLDSYVPSVLQVQYYKQAQANAIQPNLKDAAAVNPIKKPSEYQKVPASSSLRYSYQNLRQ